MQHEYRVLNHEGHGDESACMCGKDGGCVCGAHASAEDKGCDCGNCGC